MRKSYCSFCAIVGKQLGKDCKSGEVFRYTETREDLVPAQHWAHVRRKFFDTKEHARPECEQILALIAKLLEIEAKLEMQVKKEYIWQGASKFERR